MFSAAQNLALVRTELDKVFYQNFDAEYSDGRATAETEEIFKHQPTNLGYFIFEVFKGIAYYSTVDEGQTVPVQTPKVSYKMTIAVNTYAVSVPLSKVLFDDDSQLHNTWQRLIENAAIIARRTQEQSAFAIFNNAFTTTLTADGNAFIGSHTLLNGQTYTNQLTNATSASGSSALGFDSFNSAVTLLAQQPDQSGVIQGNEPAVLLVPTTLFTTALQLTQSVLQPFAGDNSLNVFRSQYSLKVYHSPYLTSTTAWFLLARNHSVTRLFRQGVETYLRYWGESDNLTYNYIVNYRESYFVGDYSGSIGSNGTS